MKVDEDELWDDYEDIPGTRDITERSRWSVFGTQVVRHKETGLCYRYDWEDGATEMQEVEREGWYELTQVHLEEVKVMEWVPCAQ